MEAPASVPGPILRHPRRAETAQADPSPHRNAPVWGGLAFLLTLAAALVGLQLQTNGIAQFWPAAGIIAGLLARAPRPAVPYVVLGAFLALAAGNATLGWSLDTSAFFMAGNLVEAAMVAWALRRSDSSASSAFSSPVLVAVFLLTVLVAVAVTGLAAARGLILSGHTTAPFAEMWQVWFLSHATGFITVAPATILIGRALFAPRYRRDHAAIAAYVIIAAPLALFHEVMTVAPSVALGLVFIGPLVWWMTLANPAPRAALATLIVAGAIVADATWAEGFFVIEGGNGPAILLALGSAILLLGGFLAGQESASLTTADAEGARSGLTVTAPTGARSASALSALILFCSACVLTGGFGQSLGPMREAVAIWWPPNGLLLAALLLHSRREWGWWLAAATIAELFSNVIWFHNPAPLALAFNAVNTFEAVLAALLLERFFPRPVRVAGLRQVGMLVLVGGGIAPMLAAIGGAALNTLRNKGDFASNWAAWWIGDASGILIAAPVVLVIAELWRRHRLITVPRAGEAFAVAGLLAVACGAAHHWALTPYLVLPPVLWAAARFEFKGAIAAIAFVAVATSLLDTFGADFHDPDASAAHLAMEQQLYLVIVTLSALFTAALAHRQNAAMNALARSNAELERRVAERTGALSHREAEARARADEIEAIYAAAPVGLAVVDNDLRYVRINQLLADINGISVDDHIGRTVQEVVPDLGEQASDALRRVLAGAEVRGVELTGTTPAQPGVVRTWLETWLPLRDAAGNVVGVTISAEDITERKVLERRRAFRWKLARTTRAIADPDEVMAAAAALLGKELGVAKVGFGETDDSGDRLIVRREWGDGRIPAATSPWLLDDFGHGVMQSLKAGETVAIADVSTDSRTSAPEVLAAFASVNIGSVLNVGLLSEKGFGGILFVQDPGPRQWTDEEIALVEAARDHLWLELQHKRAEARLRDSEARYRALSERLEDLVRERTAALHSEVRQRETAQAALFQSQKLEAIGQLTSGIAHDFNNVVAAISGGFRLIERRTQDDRIIQIAQHGARAAERGASIVKQLLAFARQQALAPRRVSFAELMVEAEPLLRHSIGPAVQLHVDCPDGLPPLWVDMTQLETALINLTINARDAMPDGGELHIAAHHCPPDAAGRPPELEDRDAIAIAVRDTGCGMTPEVLRRALEPFFTTKEAGKGTGLGMAMVLGFAQQSGGCLHIASSVGEGTAVTLYLPVAAADQVSAPILAAGPVTAGPAGARILLVDDDDAVRAITAAQLNDLGFAVEDAPGGAEALRILDGGTRFDAIVSDVVMPGMSGPALAAEVRRTQANLPILFMTGHADRDVLKDEKVIDKPFTAEDLAQALAGLLEPASLAAAAQTG